MTGPVLPVGVTTSQGEQTVTAARTPNQPRRRQLLLLVHGSEAFLEFEVSFSLSHDVFWFINYGGKLELWCSELCSCSANNRAVTLYGHHVPPI